MKKNLKSVMVLLMASPLAFAQNVESYSDNNIAYPSVTTDSKEFNPEDYVLESLDIPDFSEAFGSESYPEYIAAPDVDDILPTVNPAESYFLTSSSGNGLETYNDKDLQTPSRSITIAQNQYVDIEYPGKGWIYLGETDNTTFMRYFGHTLTEDTVFTMRAKSQGTALLHFYKIDPLTGNAINDYLEVIISGKTASEDHVLAPSYKDAVPEGQRKKNSQTKAAEKIDVDSSDSEKVAEETKDIQTTTPESMAALAKDEQVAKVDEPEKTTQASSPSETASTKPAETASVQNNSGASSQTTKPASSSTGTSSASRTSSTATASTTKPASSSASTASATRPAPAPAASSSTPSRTETVQETYPQTPKTVETPSVNSVASQKPATTSSAQAAPKTNSSKRNDTISSAADNELLAKAQTAYDKGQYADCLDYLTEFFNNAVTRIDEGLYLQGRALEAPSSSRNIKAALDTYETLVKRYPQSKKWSSANERVIYIKRFYFNIR